MMKGRRALIKKLFQAKILYTIFLTNYYPNLECSVSISLIENWPKWIKIQLLKTQVSFCSRVRGRVELMRLKGGFAPPVDHNESNTYFSV